MNKRKAIRLFEKQKQIFIDKTYTEIYLWKDFTQSLIERFVGKDSPEYLKIKDFRFGTTDPNYVGLNVDKALEIQTKIVIGLIDNCIEKIKINGLINQSSFFNTLKRSKEQIKDETKTTTTISGVMLVITITVISGLIILFIWAMWGDQIIAFFKEDVIIQ